MLNEISHLVWNIQFYFQSYHSLQTPQMDTTWWLLRFYRIWLLQFLFLSKAFAFLRNTSVITYTVVSGISIATLMNIRTLCLSNAFDGVSGSYLWPTSRQFMNHWGVIQLAIFRFHVSFRDDRDGRVFVHVDFDLQLRIGVAWKCHFR
jgi:hypothetical protein